MALTTISEPSWTLKVGPGTEPLYASMRTVSTPISFATGAIRRSTDADGATSTTSLSRAAARPSVADGNWSAARVGAGSFMGARYAHLGVEAIPEWVKSPFEGKN